jgi:hypothetical protein
MSWKTEEWRKPHNHDPDIEAPFKRESLNQRRRFRREARNVDGPPSWVTPPFGIVDEGGTVHYVVKAI